MYEAILHAQTTDGASLVVVDEINRGPAVAVFGDLIGSMERDKRLAPDGARRPASNPIRVVSDGGGTEECFVPAHLYILAAMNEADTSVEPLDVAFRRRFTSIELAPDVHALRRYLQLPETASPLPPAAASFTDVYEALASAWVRINGDVALLRGTEYSLGHGLFMQEEPGTLPTELPKSLAFAVGAWGSIHGYLRELFSGDTRALGAVLHADLPGSPYELEEREIADRPAVTIRHRFVIDESRIYDVLRAIGSAG